MPTHPEAEAIERSVDERFLDLLCSDTELVRAEFDAIIAAEWPDPPSPEIRRQPASGPRPEHPRRPSAEPSMRQIQDWPLRPEAWRRQRSPPRPDGLSPRQKGR